MEVVCVTNSDISVAKQIVFDICVHLPFMYYPCFYMVKSAVKADEINPVKIAKNAADGYTKNFREDQTAMVQCWLPADVRLCERAWVELYQYPEARATVTDSRQSTKSGSNFFGPDVLAVALAPRRQFWVDVLHFLPERRGEVGMN